MLASSGSSNNLVEREGLFLFSSTANLPTSSDNTDAALDSALVSSGTSSSASSAQLLCLVSGGGALVEEAESDMAEEEW